MLAKSAKPDFGLVSIPLSVGGVLMALSSSSAQAAIVSNSTPTSYTSNSTALGAMDVSVNNYKSSPTFYNQTAVSNTSASLSVSSGQILGPLAQGTLIDDTLSAGAANFLLASHTFSSGSWVDVANVPTDGSTQLFGVEFQTSTAPRYGWIGVALTDNGYTNRYSLTVTGWGYEDTGLGITAGALAEPVVSGGTPPGTPSSVPEPSTLALAAVGLALVGAASRRRERRSQAGAALAS